MKLKELREKKQLTQAAFAKKLGVKTAVISAIETGKKEVTDEIAAKAKEVFNVAVETAAKAEKKVKKQVKTAAKDAKAKATKGTKAKKAEVKAAPAKASSMSKAELIKKVAEENKLTQKAAAAAVNTIFDTIVETVATKEQVSLFGFGTFSVKHRDARQGRNPATGETIEIAASETPVFKAAKAFKEKVNE